jgi:hypothetical protein
LDRIVAMASAIERLKSLAANAVAPTHVMERRILAETGLQVAHYAEPKADHVALTQALLPLTMANDLPALACAFTAHFDAPRFCSTGFRTYRIVQAILMASMEEAALSSDQTELARALAALEAWWLRDRNDPAAAASFARGLTIAANATHAALGAPSTAVEYCHKARAILAHAAPTGRNHWLWRQADIAATALAWTLGLDDEDALLPAFTAIQALDPYEFGIYDDRTAHLLHQWTVNRESLEVFACASADRTADRFGDLLYARIYDTVLRYEDPETTRIDIDRFFSGFTEWQNLFPSQPLINRHAAHAHAFGDHGRVADLFRNALRQVHLSHWFYHAQPLDAWRDAAKTSIRHRA